MGNKLTVNLFVIGIGDNIAAVSLSALTLSTVDISLFVIYDVKSYSNRYKAIYSKGYE